MHDLFIRLSFLFVIIIGILYGIISFLPFFMDDIDKIRTSKKVKKNN